MCQSSPTRMLRRRLVLSSSSDEEDDEPQIQPPQPQSPPPPPRPILTPTADSLNPNPTASSFSVEPLEISDDDADFIDVSENLSPPSPPNPNPNPNPPPPPPRPPSAGGCQIGEILWRLGLGLKREWLDSCIRRLEEAVPGFVGLEVDAKAKLCFEKFLVSDMNCSGCGGVLPENVDRLHLVDLPGPFVLQVDEIVNISNPLKGRYQKAAAGIKRCLKLSMTDGVQRVFGMEYRSIKNLDALAPAGLKVVICNVHIRHGLLMLVPEAFEVLGGVVEELEAARQRLVGEVNKPPRGIRTRGGVVPSLRTRATLAAWPSNGAHIAANTNDVTSEHTIPFHNHMASETSTPIQVHDHMASETTTPFPVQNRMASETTIPFRVQNQGASYVSSGADAGQGIEGEFPGVISKESSIHNLSTNSVMDVEEFPTPAGADNFVMDVGELPIPVSAESVIPNVSPEIITGAEEAPYVVISTEEEEVLMDTIPSSRANMPDPSSDVGSIAEEVDMATIPGRTENLVSDPYPNDVLNDEEILVADDVEHQPILEEEIDMDTIPSRTENHVSDLYPNDVLIDEEIPVADEVEHPLILSGNREIPFTYLAGLSAKWTAMKKSARSVKGIVKCFLTGVKGFQYRERITYELQVYIDDGSLISEIFIHHDAVQKAVGHSPQEVMAALKSSDPTTVHNIKETMRQFQSFLMNFEGKMLIEINGASPHPVALEMNQGCSGSDAQSLLRRFKSSVPAQT